MRCCSVACLYHSYSNFYTSTIRYSIPQRVNWAASFCDCQRMESERKRLHVPIKKSVSSRDSILCSQPRLQSSDSSFREREERGLTCIRKEIKMFCPDNLYRKLMERSQRWAHDWWIDVKASLLYRRGGCWRVGLACVCTVGWSRKLM